MTRRITNRDEIGTAIGTVVRDWRRDRGWEQRELAARAGPDSGLTQTYVSKLENERSGDPGISRVLAICHAFNRTISDLLMTADLMEYDPREGARAALYLFESLSEMGQHQALQYLDMLVAREARFNGRSNL